MAAPATAAFREWKATRTQRLQNLSGFAALPRAKQNPTAPTPSFHVQTGTKLVNPICFDIKGRVFCLQAWAQAKMAEAIASMTRQLRAKAGTGKRQEAPESSSSFFIMCTGQVESGEFDGSDNLYCRYALTYGSDWTVMHGPDAGLSQIARKLGGEDTRVVWNFPIDITFKTTNAFGWPRIAISVYGIDSLGRDVVQGYGSVLIPTTSGQHERLVVLYRPVASSRLRQFLGWVAGAMPEFFDSKFVNQGDGREVTRVETTGMVKVKLNIMTKGMGRFGYSCREPDSQRSANALATSAFEGSSSLLLDKSTGGNTLLPPRTSVPASLR